MIKISSFIISVKLKSDIDGLMVIREKSNWLFILNVPNIYEIKRC